MCEGGTASACPWLWEVEQAGGRGWLDLGQHSPREEPPAWSSQPDPAHLTLQHTTSNITQNVGILHGMHAGRLPRPAHD